MMKKSVVVILAWFVFIAPGWAEPLTSEDITALHQKQLWQEVLYEANRVPPAKRTKDWDLAVTESIKAMLKDYKTANGAYMEKLFFINDIFPRYYNLFKAKEIQGDFMDTTLSLLTDCYESNYRSYDVSYCGEFFVVNASKIPQKHDYLMEVAGIVRKTSGNASLLLFQQALRQKHDLDACSNDEFLTVLDAGLSLPASDKGYKLAKEMGFGFCFKYLKPDFIQETTARDGYYLKNICQELKSKKISLPGGNKC